MDGQKMRLLRYQFQSCDTDLKGSRGSRFEDAYNIYLSLYRHRVDEIVQCLCLQYKKE